MAGLVNYYCENCKRSRKTVVLPDVHNINLTASANGLVTYSDIHKCKDDIKGVSNIHIDAHYNVRGIEHMKLPKTAILLKEEPKSRIPIPTAVKTGTMLLLTDLIPGQLIKLIYKNKEFNYQIRIGNPKKDDEPLSIIESTSKNSALEFFAGDYEFTEELDEWFVQFIEMVDNHPPISLGILIEALMYIFDNYDRIPEAIDIKILSELFTSHLIRPVFLGGTIEDALVKLESQMKDELLANMKTIVADMDMNPGQPIYTMAALSKDLISLILNFYLLEKLRIIKLDRTSVTDEKRDLAIREEIMS